MSLLNKWVAFTVICVLKALMDVANFIIPHNTGFFSLTSGWFDMWHIGWWLILLIIGFMFTWNKNNWQRSALQLCAFGAIAYIVQAVLYNFLFKLE